MEMLVDFGKETDKKELYRVLKSRKPKLYRVEIKEHRDKRSSNANGYLWGVVYATIAQETGFSSDELHEIFKGKFLTTDKVLKQTGQVFSVPGSTADLDKVQFGEYLDNVLQFALTELDCYIPQPGETIMQTL